MNEMSNGTSLLMENGKATPDTNHCKTNSDAVAIHVERPAYTQHEFDEVFGTSSTLSKTTKESCSNKIKDCFTPNKDAIVNKFLCWFPFITIMRNYQWRNWLVSDIVAGLCVGVIHIPQSMGFSLLTSLPPVYGLYSTIYPILIYFFFGTSRHISVGTMAVVSLMIGAVVEREAANFDWTKPGDQSNITYVSMTTNETELIDIPSRESELVEFKVGIATSVTLLVGIIQVIMYLLNLGVIATFMSMSFIGGFMSGAACHILTSQVPFMLGIKPPRQAGAFRLPKTWYWILRMLGDTNLAELVIALLCIVILFILKEIINEKYKKKLKVPIPAELLVVGIGIVVSYFTDLNQHFNVRIIADVPTGLPAPEVPSMYNAQAYVTDAFAIALVSYALSMSLAKTFAQKFQYNIDQNQELLAHGLVHSISSFFFCFGGAQAPPRTLVHVSTGGKTQFASLISMVMVILVCLFVGPVMEPLPNSVLAAVIGVALIPLFRQIKDCFTLLKINKQDSIVWMISFLAVVIIDVDFGLYIGIGVSLFMVILKTKSSRGVVISQAGNTELFATKSSTELVHNDNVSNPIRVFRFESPLYFVNADSFKSSLFINTVNPHMITQDPPENGVAESHITNTNTTLLDKIRNQRDIVGIVLDCSAVFYVDVMGLSVLKQLKHAYESVNIRLMFANCNEELMQKMTSYEMDTNDCCFPSVQDAVVWLETKTNVKSH